MKNLSTIFFLIIAFSATLVAQNASTLIVFSEDGLPFDLVLNGVKQNDTQLTNIRVEGLTQPYYSARIIFKEKTLGELEKKNLIVQDMDGLHAEATYVIKQDKKGRFKLKFYSAIPIKTAPAASADVTTVEYTPVPRPVTSTTIEVTETTISSEPTVKGTEEININLDVDMTGMDINMDVEGTNVAVDMDSERDDINIDMDIRDPNISGTTTTTTTTTTSSTTINGVTTEHTITEKDMVAQGGNYAEPRPNLSQVNRNCMNGTMSDYDFQDAKKSIQEKTFEDDKLTISKQIAGGICLTSEQVKEIMMLYTHEGTKLEFAKYAHKKVIDPANYYKVNDAFTHSMTVDELDEFIQK